MPEGSLLLPNFTTLGLSTFDLRTNPNCYQATEDALSRMQQAGLLPDEDLAGLRARQFGLLGSLCYPTCGLTQLQLIIRFIIWMRRRASGYLPESGGTCSTEEKEIIGTFYGETPEDWPCRFNHDIRWYHYGQQRTAESRRLGTIPNLETYKTLRRDASGLMLLFDIIEYARGLHIPDAVHTSPKMERLKQTAVDIIAWSQDIASYNVQQSVDDKINLVAVHVAAHGFVQTGLDETKEDVKAAFKSFFAAERDVLDEKPLGDVRTYLQGLRDCIVGHAHWIYYTDLFFRDGDEARENGWVKILPKKKLE